MTSFTGENLPVERSVDWTDEDPLHTHNLAFGSTGVSQGSGKGVCINTGDRAMIGRLAAAVRNTEQQATPLQVEMFKFVLTVCVISITGGGLFFTLGMVVYKAEFSVSLVNAIGIIIANVPEGLIATLTLCLTLVP